jgi:hypothetical protein
MLFPLKHPVMQVGDHIFMVNPTRFRPRFRAVMSGAADTADSRRVAHALFRVPLCFCIEEPAIPSPMQISEAVMAKARLNAV